MHEFATMGGLISYFRRNSVVVMSPAAYKEEQNLEALYGKEVSDAVHSGNKLLSSFPVLDLQGRMGATDYVDMVDPQEMTAPVMRFVDKFNRPGLVFRLRGLGEHADICNTVAWFQRYTNDPRIWTYGMGHSDNTITNVYGGDFHRAVMPEYVKGWLLGTDLLFVTQ